VRFDAIFSVGLQHFFFFCDGRTRAFL
jgi:hypothetical protein